MSTKLYEPSAVALEGDSACRLLGAWLVIGTRQTRSPGLADRSGKADELQMSGVRKELGVARNSTKERLTAEQESKFDKSLML